MIVMGNEWGPLEPRPRRTFLQAISDEAERQHDEEWRRLQERRRLIAMGNETSPEFDGMPPDVPHVEYGTDEDLRAYAAAMRADDSAGVSYKLPLHVRAWARIRQALSL